MNKIKAADYLGISLRTLENHMKANRISFAYLESDKSRPVVDFAESELDRFKAELESGRRVTATVTATSPVPDTASAATLVTVKKPAATQPVTASNPINSVTVSTNDLRELITLAAGQGRADVTLDKKLLLTIPEAMSYSGLKEKPIRDAIKEGGLKSVRIGRSIQVRPVDLQKWVDSQFEG